MHPEYSGRNRFPKLQPKGFCRGCRGPITEKNRITWCSLSCKKKFDPFYVKEAVRKRCEDKCEMCGTDCSRKAVYEWKFLAPKMPLYRDCGLEYPYDPKAHYRSPIYKAYEAARKEWRQNSPRPEYDHIIPHCEGGLFVLENIRMLCRKCHLKRTAEWRKTRKKK